MTSMSRILQAGFIVAISAMSCTALAQGDARFCANYASNASGVGEAAVKKNPACLDPSRGVHGNYQSHFDWCMRNPPSSVQGAEANIRRLASQCTASASKPAPARSRGTHTEKQYATVGKWKIIAASEQNKFHYCAADLDNDQVTLRIATDGREWQLGNAYYEKKPIKGKWGFDGWESEATFRADGDGWATMDMNKHMLDSFRRSPSFSIQLDRGPQTWNIKGASAALDKTLECARNKGSAGQTASSGVSSAPSPSVTANNSSKAVPPSDSKPCGGLAGGYNGGASTITVSNGNQVRVTVGPNRPAGTGSCTGKTLTVNFPDDRTLSGAFNGRVIEWNNRTTWTKD